jgi:outer membrane protein assembly factor BamA
MGAILLCLGRRPSLSIVVLTLSCVMTIQTTKGQDTPRETVYIQASEVVGLRYTKPDTILELLVHPVPGEFTREELSEFERRIRNLSLFDKVRVALRENVLYVEVQEKITLAPILDFTTGKTLQDTSVSFGVVEYNIGGTGTQLGGEFSYSQRGPNAEVWISQHSYHPTRWAKELKMAYNSNGFRFEDSSTKWTRRRMGGEFELKGPFSYWSSLRYEVVVRTYRELVEDTPGNHPSNGYYVGIAPEVIWDRYHWHDLVPSGYRISLELRPGYFVGPNQNRHEARLRYLQGIPLAAKTVLMVDGVAEAVNEGNANHSVLIGSVTGVRGLPDNLFRNRAQSYANVELRHAMQVAPRWALQGVLFTDAGAFQRFTEGGQTLDWTGAVNVGAGLRVVPTFLSNTLLRIDFARLLSAQPASLVQVGITQYF